MNAAIYIRGKDKIEQFIRDCQQEGNNFYGSNGSRTGVKPHLFGVRWTNDEAALVIEAETGLPLGYDKALSDLKACRTYLGHPVGNAKDVDAISKARIANAYPPEEEAKLLRKALAAILYGTITPDLKNEFKAYDSTVEEIVNEGKQAKVDIK